MTEGILKTHREELGLTGREFKASPMFPDLYRRAYDLAGCLQQTDVIVDLRALKPGKAFGRGGVHSYRTIVPTDKGRLQERPKVLQGYEFGLLAQATIDLKKAVS
jgi:hypothetical protein